MMDSAQYRNTAFPIRSDINWNLCQNTHEFVHTMNAPTFSSSIVDNNYPGALSLNNDMDSNISSTISGNSHRKRKNHGLQSTESDDEWDNFRGRKVYISEKKMMSKFSQMNLDLEPSTYNGNGNIMNGDLNMIPLSNSRNQPDEGVIIEELFDDEEFSTEEEDNGDDFSVEFADVLKYHLDKKNQNVLPDKIMNKIIEPKLSCRELVLWQPPVLERFQHLDHSNPVQQSSSSASRRQALKATRHFTNSNNSTISRVGSDAEMDCSSIPSDEIPVNSNVFSCSSNDLPSFSSATMSPTWNIPSCSLIQEAWSGSQDDDMMS